MELQRHELTVKFFYKLIEEKRADQKASANHCFIRPITLSNIPDAG